MSADKEIVKSLKSLITKTFWRGMDCGIAFAIATRALIDMIWNGRGTDIVYWIIVPLFYVISLLSLLAYLGLHKKIDKINKIENI